MTNTLEYAHMEGNDHSIWGYIAGGFMTISSLLYVLWGRMKFTRTGDNTGSEALESVSAAVAHWQKLYDVAWAQVVKERELREAAEQRALKFLTEMESLRDEVAALKREVKLLRADLDKPPTRPASL